MRIWDEVAVFAAGVLIGYGATALAKRRRRASQTPAPANSAFDAYRRATLDRLRDEEAAFRAFLGNLRRAKDHAELDQFERERSEPQKNA